MQRQNKWRFIGRLLFFVALTLLSSRFYFHQGLPVTHDSIAHVVRFANYKMAIKEGQLPPRLAPNLMNGYTYPAFNYNYPLANILSLPFSFAKVHYETTFKILMSASLLLGFWGAWLLLRQAGFGRAARLFSVALFALNPYLYTSVIFRGNIGEIMAAACLPWILYVLIRLRRPQAALLSFDWLLLTGALIILFLAHNITAFFASGMLIFYLLFAYGKNWRAWRLFLSSFAVAFMASLWFWLPALLEKSLVILDKVDLSLNYYKHFPTLSQLLSWPLRFGYSYWGSVDSMSLGLGLTQLVVLVLAVIYALRRLTLTVIQRVWLVLGVLLVFGQTLASRWFYDTLPFFEFIQFPWRLSLLLAVVLVPLAALTFAQSRWRGRLLLSLLLVLQLVQFWQVRPIDYHHRDRIDYEQDPSTTSTNHENRPINFEYDYGKSRDILVEVLDDPAATVTLERFFGSKHFYELTLTQPSRIVEATAYFEGFKTWANGELLQYVDDQEIAGRVAYQLPAGQYRVETRFTQDTWPRKIGNTVSALTYLLLIVVAAKTWQKARRNKVAR